MNNGMLEFIVKMKDLASSGLTRLAQTARQTFTTVTNGADGAVRSNDRLSSSFERIRQRAQASNNSISSMGKSLTAYIGIAAALSFGGGAIKSAMDYGATKQSFQVLTGSEKKGNALAGGLNKLQQDTILGPEVFKNAQTMMGFGIGAEKVIPTLKMLGDVSMGNAEKLGSLTLAFSQVQAGGKLTGQDMIQFINAGFNPLDEIARTTGKSLSQLKDDMAKGAISSEMVAKAFESATGKGGLYNNMLNKLAETPMGKLQQLMGSYENLKIKIGEALMPIASTFMNIATFLIDHIEIVGAVAAAWGSYSLVTKAAEFYQALLNNTMKVNPILLLISVIVGLIVWVGAMMQKNESWATSIMAIWEIIKAFGQLAWLPFKYFGESAWYFVQRLWLNIEDFAQSIVATFEKVGNAWNLAKSGDFSGAKEALTANVQTQASKDIVTLDATHKANQQGYMNELLMAKATIKTNVSKINFKNNAAGETDNSLSASGIANAGGAGGGAVAGGGDKSSSVAGGVASSGPRNITINLGKLFDNININTTSIEGGLQGMEEKIQESLLRVLNSGAAVQ